jgi:hypothetical protein
MTLPFTQLCRDQHPQHGCSSRKELASCRISASLLSHITRINWNQDMTETCASGEVLSSAAGVQLFDMSIPEKGEDLVTDGLWQLIM